MAERARRPLRATRPQAFRFGSLPPSPLRPSTLPMPSRRGRLRPRRLPDLRHHRARRVAGEGSRLDGGPRGCRRPLPRPCHEVLSVSQRRGSVGQAAQRAGRCDGRRLATIARPRRPGKVVHRGPTAHRHRGPLRPRQGTRTSIESALAHAVGRIGEPIRTAKTRTTRLRLATAATVT